MRKYKHKKLTRLKITTYDELLGLITIYKIFGRKVFSIDLDMTELTYDQNRFYSDCLTHYYKACGCSEGTIAGIICGLIAALILVPNFFINHRFTIVQMFISYFSLTFLAMTIGKIYGIAKARKKFCKCIAEIKCKIKNYGEHIILPGVGRSKC